MEAEDELSVVEGEITEKRGMIDIKIKHLANEECLLFEVKPCKRDVYSAVGQILRYRYESFKYKSLTHLSSGDLHLMITAPDFYESHRKTAETIGIELLQHPMQSLLPNVG